MSDLVLAGVDLAYWRDRIWDLPSVVAMDSTWNGRPSFPDGWERTDRTRVPEVRARHKTKDNGYVYGVSHQIPWYLSITAHKKANRAEVLSTLIHELAHLAAPDDFHASGKMNNHGPQFRAAMAAIIFDLTGKTLNVRGRMTIVDNHADELAQFAIDAEGPKGKKRLRTLPKTEPVQAPIETTEDELPEPSRPAPIPKAVIDVPDPIASTPIDPLTRCPDCTKRTRKVGIVPHGAHVDEAGEHPITGYARACTACLRMWVPGETRVRILAADEFSTTWDDG